MQLQQIMESVKPEKRDWNKEERLIYSIVTVNQKIKKRACEKLIIIPQ
jgi:hypothetical protein